MTLDAGDSVFECYSRGSLRVLIFLIDATWIGKRLLLFFSSKWDLSSSNMGLVQAYCGRNINVLPLGVLVASHPIWVLLKLPSKPILIAR